jgi:hypothetical protein
VRAVARSHGPHGLCLRECVSPCEGVRAREGGAARLVGQEPEVPVRRGPRQPESRPARPARPARGSHLPRQRPLRGPHPRHQGLESARVPPVLVPLQEPGPGLDRLVQRGLVRSGGGGGGGGCIGGGIAGVGDCRRRRQMPRICITGGGSGGGGAEVLVGVGGGGGGDGEAEGGGESAGVVGGAATGGEGAAVCGGGGGARGDGVDGAQERGGRKGDRPSLKVCV